MPDNGGVDPPWKAIVIALAAMALIGWAITAGCSQCGPCPVN